jgi:ABC-type multidrug transport system permease subunit
VAIGAAYLGAFRPAGTPAWAPWAMAIGTTVVLVALMLLGMARDGRRLGWLWGVLAFTAVVCIGGFGLALALPPDVAGARLIAGLPPRAAAVLYGIGFLPLAVLPIAYALSFDRLVLTPDDLARLRASVSAGARPSPSSDRPAP